MIAVLQRVKYASVKVEGRITGKCEKGIFILLGVKKGDTKADAEALASKISRLRIFSDENGKMNLSVCDVGGEALVVSNFTLMAAYKKGNRPDYMNAAAPQEANELYEHFCTLMEQYMTIGRGIFGADMEIEACCDGPVTITMDSDVLLGKA